MKADAFTGRWRLSVVLSLLMHGALAWGAAHLFTFARPIAVSDAPDVRFLVAIPATPAPAAAPEPPTTVSAPPEPEPITPPPPPTPVPEPPVTMAPPEPIPFVAIAPESPTPAAPIRRPEKRTVAKTATAPRPNPAPAAPAGTGSPAGAAGTREGGGASGTGKSSAARVRSNPPPTYPAEARIKKQEGVVVVRVSVSTSGAAEDVQVRRSSGFSLLDNAAVSAVRRWRFEPATAAGIAVRSTVEVPVRFRLQN